MKDNEYLLVPMKYIDILKDSISNETIVDEFDRIYNRGMDRTLEYIKNNGKVISLNEVNIKKKAEDYIRIKTNHNSEDFFNKTQEEMISLYSEVIKDILL